MERNKGTRRETAKMRRRAIAEWIITKTTVIVLAVACIISFVSTQATLLEKRQELEELEQAVEQARDEHMELEKFIGSNDLEGYMEKAAIEELNYAYPNERRFYDTSRN